PRRDEHAPRRPAPGHGVRDELDALHRTHPRGHPHPRRRQRDPRPGRGAPRGLLAGPGGAVPARRPPDRPVPRVLEGLPALPAVGRARRRWGPPRRRRADGHRHLHHAQRLPHPDHARLADLAPMTLAAAQRTAPPGAAEGTAPAVSLRGVVRRMGRETVLRGIDLDVAPGRLVVLRGSNGSGKTTLLRLLGTRLRPHAGVARVFGHDLVRQADRVRARVGLLGAAGGSYPVLTGRENLRLALSLAG